MIDVIFGVVGLLCLIGLAWSIWGMHCCNKVGVQRREILDAVYAYRRELLLECDYATFEGFKAIFEEDWERVSFDVHMREATRLRDPMRLFSLATLAAIEWHKTMKAEV